MLITENGLQIESWDDINERVREKLLRGDISLTFLPNSPEKLMADTITEFVYETQTHFIKMFSNLMLPTAEGIFLERINPTVKRKNGTATRVLVTISVDRALSLGTDFVVQDTQGKSFSLEQPQDFLTAGDYDCYFVCTEIGAITVKVNTVNTIQTTRTGVLSVNNTQAGITGDEFEYDFIFKRRLGISAPIKQTGTTEALLPALLNLQGVEDALIIKNRPSGEKGYQEGRIWSIVAGGDSVEIARTINEKRICAKLQGNVQETLETTGGSPEIIRFDRQTDIDIAFSFQVYQEQSAKKDISDLLPTLKEEIVKIFNQEKRKIGASISNSALTSVSIKACQNILPKEILFSIIDTSMLKDSVAKQVFETDSYKQRFVLNVSNITITTNYTPPTP